MSTTAPQPQAESADQTVDFKQGDVIFNEGDPGGDLFIIKVGVVTVYKTAHGKEINLGKLGKNDLLGSMTCINGSPRNATARAVTDVKAVKVPKEKIANLVKSVPKWTLALITDLVTRVQLADALLIENMSKEPQQQHSTLQTAAQVARFCAIAGKLNLAKSPANAVISIDDLIPDIVEMTQLTEAVVSDLVHLYRKCGFFERQSPETSKDMLSRLTLFSQFVSHTDQDQIDRLHSFNVKERETLFYTVQIAINEGAKWEQDLETDAEEMINKIKKTYNHIVKSDCYERAHKIGLIKLGKSDQMQIVFTPKTLLEQVLFARAIVEIAKKDGHNKTNKIRTLVY